MQINGPMHFNCEGRCSQEPTLNQHTKIHLMKSENKMLQTRTKSNIVLDKTQKIQKHSMPDEYKK